jgi:hypothetical protein
MMMRTPLLLRVKLAFSDYPVGYLFKSPPLPGTLRQEWISRGYLEVMDEEEKPEVPEEREKFFTPKPNKRHR